MTETSNTQEKLKEIKRSFRLLMNGEASKSMREKGLDYHLNWGVAFTDLKQMAQEYGKDYSRLFISLGSKDHVSPGTMMGFVNRVVDNREVSIGKIDIQKNFSFFEVDTEHLQEVLDAMRDAQFDGQSVTVEQASSNGEHTPHKPNRKERRAAMFGNKDDWKSRDNDRASDRIDRNFDRRKSPYFDENDEQIMFGKKKRERNEYHRKGFRGK